MLVAVKCLELAVMVQVPSLTPVTTPLVETVATESSLLDQVMEVSVAFEGVQLGEIFTVLPTMTSVEAGRESAVGKMVPGNRRSLSSG